MANLPDSRTLSAHPLSYQMTAAASKTVEQGSAAAFIPKPQIFERSPEFREAFNRRPFMVSHKLAGHPLFELSRLTELCRLLKKKDERNVAFYPGDRPITQGWRQPSRRPLSAEEGIARIEESDSWVLLKSVQLDPEYAPLLERSIAELEHLTGTPLRREITWQDAYIFISSPGSITPYHFDHESNFLLQIHGEKEVNLFDPDDRSILSEEEIERYYVGYLSSANYRNEIQSKAQVFHLSPGRGVHHPVRAPHWVRNGEDYSVSLSILFFLREYDRQAQIYQTNHYLRKLRIRPNPPGKSAFRDAVKMRAMGLPSFRRARSKYELLRYRLWPALVVRSLARRFKRRGRTAD